MALKKTIQIRGSVELPTAYIKVININGDKNSIRYTVAAFKDKAVADTDPNNFVSILTNGQFEPEVGNLDFIAQAYANCKTMVIFDGAEDC